MSKKTKNMLELNSFKNWQYGNYKITQYKRFMFIVSIDGKDVGQTKTLRGAVKYAANHGSHKAGAK